jgi:hypothetical protein
MAWSPARAFLLAESQPVAKPTPADSARMAKIRSVIFLLLCGINTMMRLTREVIGLSVKALDAIPSSLFRHWGGYGLL